MAGGRSPAGFTLLEVILTLALLAGMAAILWPALEKPFASARLRNAGDLVRAQWTSARVQAMSTGLVQAFRYQPGTGDFTVSPWEHQETSDSPEVSAEEAAGAGYVVSTAPAAAQSTSLPDRIEFVSDEVAEDARAAFLQGGGQVQISNNTDSIRAPKGADGAGAAGAAGQPWSTPILFYPDGTTSTARVLLANEHGRQVIVQLRGLTGVASVAEAE